MKHLFVPVFGMLAILTVPAFADENACASFFEQDIHDKLIVIDTATGRQVSSSSLCSNESSSSSSGLSVEYAGVGVGYDQANALARALCDNKFSEGDFSSNNSVYRSVVDPSIVQAALECYKLNAKGLHYSIHSEQDTHSVTISMSYDGPQSIGISDIVINGNAKCEGSFYTDWSANKEKKAVLGTNTIAISCSPKDAIDSKASSDIAAGSITVVTDAGPIYAQIPRRFSVSLEQQFADLQAKVTSLRSDAASASDMLARRVIGAATIKDGQIQSISSGLTVDVNSGRVSFQNPNHLHFVPVISAISPNGVYLTESCYVRSLGEDFVILWQGAQDTSGRNGHPINCTITLVAFGS